MLDGLIPGEFDEWLAYREIEPDQLDRIITILRLGFTYLCNAWEMKIEPHHVDPYLEQEDGQKRGGVSEVSPEQGAAMVSMVLGAPN